MEYDFVVKDFRLVGPNGKIRDVVDEKEKQDLAWEIDCLSAEMQMAQWYGAVDYLVNLKNLHKPRSEVEPLRDEKQREYKLRMPLQQDPKLVMRLLKRQEFLMTSLCWLKFRNVKVTPS